MQYFRFILAFQNAIISKSSTHDDVCQATFGEHFYNLKNVLKQQFGTIIYNLVHSHTHTHTNDLKNYHYHIMSSYLPICNKNISRIQTSCFC